jgi:hypothetical protein
MRRFELHRDQDTSGVSGTGVVAQGIEFTDGTCALRWLSEHRSTALYDSTRDIELIHGHGGLTRLVWLDRLPRVLAKHQATGDEQYLRSPGRRQDIIRRLEVDR